MINRNDWVEDFQKNISDLISRSPAADIERNMKAFMAQTFSRMDLVTREELDIQSQLLERSLQRISALESRLDQLEGKRSPTPSAQEAQADIAAETGVTPSAGANPATSL